MSEIFVEPTDPRTQHQIRGEGILKFGNQVADDLVRLYRMGREMLWQVPGYKVADAQAVIDAMGAEGLKVFQKNAALGAFINTNFPGVLAANELSPPVAYTVVSGRVVLEPAAKYPTEK